VVDLRILGTPQSHRSKPSDVDRTVKLDGLQYGCSDSGTTRFHVLSFPGRARTRPSTNLCPALAHRLRRQEVRRSHRHHRPPGVVDCPVSPVYYASGATSSVAGSVDQFPKFPSSQVPRCRRHPTPPAGPSTANAPGTCVGRHLELLLSTWRRRSPLPACAAANVCSCFQFGKRVRPVSERRFNIFILSFPVRYWQGLPHVKATQEQINRILKGEDPSVVLPPGTYGNMIVLK